jgi:hypothetical protein
MKRITGFLVALLLTGAALADLSSLNVQFSPNATSYAKGALVGLTATSNGTNAQYKFNVHRMVAGTATAVLSTTWSSTNTLAFDTSAVNVLTGRYRIQVMARESANASETLVKTEIIVITEPPAVTSCESIDGKTYTNAAATTYNAGDRSLSQMLAGLALTLPASANAISAVSFDSGAVSVELEPSRVRVCAFICLDSQYGAGGDIVSGTYTCNTSTNVLTVNASGQVPVVSPSPAADMLGGGTFPVTVSGSLTINQTEDKLVTGTATFE